MGRRAFDMLRPGKGTIYYNTINLKQFRDAAHPRLACYQAITNAKMRMLGVNRGGLLGEGHVLMGDVSGGMSIDLHRYDALPIATSLGLRVERSHKGADGVHVDEVRPVYPFWLDVRMDYPPAETVAWRTPATGWRIGDKAASKPPENPPEYNTASSGALQAVQGPFDFPSVTVRVLPLLADPAKLTKLVREYVHGTVESAGIHIEPWGRYVYMVAGSYEEMASASDNVGSFAHRDVTFYVPVRRYDVEGGKRTLRSVALVPIYAYADRTMAAVTASEVNGIPTLRAVVEAPSDDWMADAGPSDASPQAFMRLVSQVLPVLGQGVGAEERVVAEVTEAEVWPLEDARAWEKIADGWARSLRGEVARLAAIDPDDATAARTMALEVLANGRPLVVLTLKQFRDSDEPSRACYQGLVEVERRIEHVHDLREIEGRLSVGIRAYESQPIVESLGLVVKHTTYGGDARVDWVEPVRPFWAKLHVKESLGRTLVYRVIDGEWERTAETPRYLDGERAAGDRRLGPGFDAAVAGGRVQGLAQLAHDWLDSPGAKPLDPQAARRAIEGVEPQVMIGAALSREWEHHGMSRWRRQYERLTNGGHAGQPARAGDPFEDALAEIKAEPHRADVLERVAKRQKDLGTTGKNSKTRAKGTPDDLLLLLSLARQKPAVCVRRQSAGPEREQDRYYPRESSWIDGSDAWFVSG